MKHLEITKGDTVLYIAKDNNSENILIDITFEDTMDCRCNVISLTKKEILKVIDTLQKMIN